jgi:hypothetical protein
LARLWRNPKLMPFAAVSGQAGFHQVATFAIGKSGRQERTDG